ncbi:LysR family transcriptional regulator [Cohaesibacter haloalkalitolerans]|uniref:LysR family transcriptional regulator n=1 Tax=Cohaesibacter haloalkalitolerans TaxID=1162980 RepID=UPI000E649B62|nr:LysR family transcriptional regulator [Cohaesibacter haloalkalitolerans]
MDRKDLNDMLLFMAVAEERSFTRAAARLGVSQSTLSHTIRDLESRLGIRLLARTTRNVTPTEEGERLLRSLAPRIEEIDAEVESLKIQKGRMAGTVRLTLSEDALQSVVWPKLQPVLQQHPELRVEFYNDNGFRNIVEDRLDAGVRLGESVDQDMIGVRIGPDWRLVAVASPSYLSRNPAPLHPRDLLNHVCINHRQRPEISSYAWEFEKDGQELCVQVEGQLSFNSSIAMTEAAKKGFGIAYLPEHAVQALLSSGDLVLLLDEWSPKFSGYHLYYPSRKQNSAAFRLVVDTLKTPRA